MDDNDIVSIETNDAGKLDVHLWFAHGDYVWVGTFKKTSDAESHKRTVLAAVKSWVEAAA